MKFLQTNSENSFQPDEYQDAKIKFTERKFKISFTPWQHALAMAVSEPVKIYAWFISSRKYSVTFDPQTKIMHFRDDGDKTTQWARFGMSHVKTFLGSAIYSVFGPIRYMVNEDAA